jgi:hypothetical protein
LAFLCVVTTRLAPLEDPCPQFDPGLPLLGWSTGIVDRGTVLVFADISTRSDPGAMEELARLRLPQRVPFGVHACWLDENMLAALAD